MVCGSVEPNSQLRLITGTVGWWTWLTWWYGKPFVVKVPTCRRCGWLLQARRGFGLLVTFAVIAVVYYWIWPFFKEFVPHGLRKWAMMGIAIACLIPLLVLEFFYAPPAQVTAYTDSVDYEFASYDYATDFAAMNHDAAWTKLNGIFMAFRDVEE